MSSRDQLLSALKQNQPPAVALPALDGFLGTKNASVDQFIKTVISIGGQAIELDSLEQLESHLSRDHFPRIVSTLPQLPFAEQIHAGTNPHELSNVSLAILPGILGVAENGATWMTEDQMGVRALPFICEHLALVVSKATIVATMHEAYARIERENYPFGTFLAGPSKTADIEQSLVLGAHGSRTLRIFITP